MMSDADAARPLKEFKPKHEYFVGIDSDGCAFDTMEIKQKECFVPNIIKHWNLQAVSKYVRETVEFINLYSKWRGINRFPALINVFDLLRQRPEVQQRGVSIPDLQPLRDWIQRETKLGNPVLKKEVERTSDEILVRALRWSEAVNATIAEIVKGVGPFPSVRKCLEKITSCADTIVVSQTPTEALNREWQEHDLARYVHTIAGQEMGTKAEHIKFAANGKYPVAHVLMIGDAPGDMEAARANSALFFPINPGREEPSWQQLYEEAFDKFIAGEYAGAYEEKLITEFEALLPERPPWEK